MLPSKQSPKGPSKPTGHTLGNRVAIEDGARVEGDWVEVGYSDGGVDWAWRETTVYGDTARSLIPIRAMVSNLIDLIDRIDDLVASQRDIGEL